MTKNEITLKSIFKENNIKYQDFTNATGISRARLHTYFSKDKKGFAKHEIALLCSILPITPHFFGQDNSIYSFKKTKDYDSIISYNYFKENNIIKNYEEFLDQYFEKIIFEVNKAKKSIVILDYVGENLFIPRKISDDGGNFKNFHNLYEQYLEAISNFIKRKAKKDKKNKIEPEPAYIRILQCPINKSKKSIKHKLKIDEVLDYSYNDMFNQFENLYKDHKDYYKLCFVEKAFRPYSIMIIDNKTIVTEYVRYNKRLEPIPDILFIDHKLVNSAFDITTVLIETHMKSINSVIYDEKKIISRVGAKLRLESIKKRYKKKIKSTEEKIEVIQSIMKLRDNKSRLNHIQEKYEQTISSLKIKVNKNNYLIKLKDSLDKLDKKELKLREKLPYLNSRLELTIRKLKNFELNED